MDQSFAIVIPTCNRPLQIRNAVRSALEAAAIGNGAVFVVDDGTEISAAQSLIEFSDSRLKLINNHGHHGPGAARNFGLCHVSQDIVFFLDDDDMIARDYCYRVLRNAVAHPAAPSFGYSAVIDRGRVRGRNLKQGPIPHDAPLKHRLSGLGMGAWIRKDIFHQAGGIDETIRVNEDTDFFLRLATMKLTGWYEERPGVILRPQEPGPIDQRSITTATDAKIRAEGFEAILSRHHKLLISEPALRRSFIFRAARYRLRAGDAKAAHKLVMTEPSTLHRIMLRLRVGLAQVI